MTALEMLQKRVDDLGIIDIKLFGSGVVTDTALVEILTSHLDGKSTKLGLIGDSKMLKTTDN